MASANVTPADRIRELSVIDEDVATMLSSAAQAINALTNRPLAAAAALDDDDDDGDTRMGDGERAGLDTVQGRKDQFKEHSKAYYTSLQAIIARLRRQAYALEEAGIIAPQSALLASSPIKTTTAPQVAPQRGYPSAPPVHEAERISNGGLGNFDISWLNSRGDKVGQEKEAELMQEAKELLEQELQRLEAT